MQAEAHHEVFNTCRDSLPASEIRKKIPDIALPPEVRLMMALMCCCNVDRLRSSLSQQADRVVWSKPSTILMNLHNTNLCTCAD